MSGQDVHTQKNHIYLAQKKMPGQDICLKRDRHITEYSLSETDKQTTVHKGTENTDRRAHSGFIVHSVSRSILITKL